MDKTKAAPQVSHRRRRTTTNRLNPLQAAFVAEFIGTFILVLFGCGAVTTAVLAEAQVGIWQVAVVWGFGITIAIYATRSISGAHLNPAVTLAFAIFRPKEFPASRVLPYFLAQLMGAFAAAALLFIVFSGAISDFEISNNIIRGMAGSQRSAMIFGEYFPNPAIFGVSDQSFSIVSTLQAGIAEAVGTAFLVFSIFALIDPRNSGKPAQHLAPFFIGFTVAIIISIIGPLTQAGLNPARDFGPRILAYLAGWQEIAIPGPRWDFLVYIIGPFIGGIVGALTYDGFIRRNQPTPHVTRPS